MDSTTISQHARIGALLGVLLTVLAASAFVLMRGNSHPATAPPPPVVQQQPKPHETVHVVRPTVNALFPAPVHSALEHYPRVVVGFYNPRSAVDRMTIEEARAGAASQHVFFVAVNVLDDSVAGPLTALLPAGQLLPNPGFAIYKRPGTLVYRSDGYLNRTSVAQAVKDAR
jgi:hypothetical protein